jgi:GT2 family glycosyltransferase
MMELQNTNYSSTSNIKANVAVLMTCYNRRDVTLNCLRQLYQQNIDFHVYLVDDGCSDGTAEAVSLKYPQVNIIKGEGNLFWGGGMHLAFDTAMKQCYEYYLWLNDDTLLNPNTLSKLLDTHQNLARQGYPQSIVVGSVTDPLTGEYSYGGRIPSKRLFSFKFDSLEPGIEPKECTTMQGNCVLIPHSVVEIVGNIDNTFIHNLGDLDYGLRARKLGCSVWVAPGYVGTCAKNLTANNWGDKSISVLKRLQKAISPKAFPLKARAIYAKRHKGPFWVFHWLLPYIRAVIGYKKPNQSSL